LPTQITPRARLLSINTSASRLCCASLREFAPALDGLLSDFAVELSAFPSEDGQIAEAGAHECRAALLRFCGGPPDIASALAALVFEKVLEDDAGKEAYLRAVADVLVAAGRAGCPWVGDRLGELLADAAGARRASESAWRTVRAVIVQGGRPPAALIAPGFVDAVEHAISADPTVLPAVLDAIATFFLAMHGGLPGNVAAAAVAFLSGARAHRQTRGAVLLAIVCVVRFHEELMAQNFDRLLQAAGQEIRSPFPESARAALDALCFLSTQTQGRFGLPLMRCC
jgi:hypothetical protein